MTRDAEQPQSLAELVRSARSARKMSLRDVEEASGGTVKFSQISAIELGKTASVQPKALAGLAKALRLPIETVRAANGDPAGAPKAPFVLPDRASLLPMRDRRLVLALVDGLLAARRGQ